MIGYDEFLVKCQNRGFDPFSYLMPEMAFKEIDDEGDYLVGDVAFYASKSERTARRWFDTGFLKAVGRRPWTCKGIDLKRALFKEFYDPIMSQFDKSYKNVY